MCIRCIQCTLWHLPEIEFSKSAFSTLEIKKTHATRINFNMSSHLSFCCWPPFAIEKAFVFACQSVCIMRYGHISFFLPTYESIAVMVLLQTKSSASATNLQLVKSYAKSFQLTFPEKLPIKFPFVGEKLFF